MLAKVRANNALMFCIETAFFLALMIALFYVLCLSDWATVQESVYNQF